MFVVSRTYTIIRVIQEILHVVCVLGELVRQDLGNRRHVGMVVRLQLHNLPETALHGRRLHGVRLIRQERVVEPLLLDLARDRRVLGRSVNHVRAARMPSKLVVYPGNDEYDGAGRRIE